MAGKAGLDSLRIRPLQPEEVATAVDWAAAEGWNPGLADIEAFRAVDPDGFAGAELDGELVGTVSGVSYGGAYGFMGFFIVSSDHRGEGIGARLWRWMQERLFGRLDRGATIGLDAVEAMKPFYAAAGFDYSHRGVRMKSTGQPGDPDPGLRPLDSLPFEQVAELDRAHFGADRPDFLRRWIAPAGGAGLGLLDGGDLRGIGVVRPCRAGFKVGPLFADGAEVAERIFTGLSGVAPSEPLYLDVPETNEAALALAERQRMSEVFACARMYAGTPPPTPWERVFGTTSFELG